MVKAMNAGCLFLMALLLCFSGSATAQENWYGPLERDWSIRLMGGAFKFDVDI
jgi:hypothetical protein